MDPSPSPPNFSKDYWKLLPLLISINWPSLVTSWVLVQKIYSKMNLVSCTNTHCDVIDLVNHGKVKNTKTWVSSEQNIIFLRNKKILNLCFRWHILRSYHFVAEVTFNENKKINEKLTDLQRKFDKLVSDNEILQSKIIVAEKTLKTCQENLSSNNSKITDLERSFHTLEQ